PDAGLDSTTRKLVYDLLTRFRDDPKITMVIASNSRPLIERLNIDVVELRHGYLLRKASHGPSSLGPAG
ncbi:MAG TPA: hypothetical protein VGM29_03760, partial [Polyangiaceae bacterium]